MTRYDKQLLTARCYKPDTYLRKFVRPTFQKMIRAEAGAIDGMVPVVIAGAIVEARSPLGYCVCVTCGIVQKWNAAKGPYSGMDAGHFLPGGRNCIVLDEANIAPQCSGCNRQGGAPEAYRKWMEHVRFDDIDRLEKAKRHEVRKFSREEMVELRIGYMDRIKRAQKIIMEGGAL